MTVLYQKLKSSERDKKWIGDTEKHFKGILLKGISTGIDNAFCPDVLKYLNKKFDYIVICGNASPTEILAIEWCRIRRIPFCIEGDGAFVSNKNGMKEKIKKHLISGSSLLFSTCKEHDKYYIKYGACPDKIVRYKFTSLKESDILTSPVSNTEKKELRKELGIKEKKVVISVGQFIYRKGFDVLLNAATGIDKSIGIYIVGSEPTQEYLDLVKKYNLYNVHFEGFKPKETLKKYYKASDVFVLPTREDIWGLVINEAMAYGLPVITTKRCNAGLELIENGKNGFLININSIEELRNTINISIENYIELGVNALTTIKEYTIENMASEHITIFKRKTVS